VAKKQRKPQYITPTGIAVYPWLNKPDTKAFDDKPAKPQFKEKHRLTTAEFEKNNVVLCNGKVIETSLKDLIDEAAEEAFQAALEENPKRQKPRKGQVFRKHVPYSDELDDDGEETGNVLVSFSQNEEIKKKDGEIIKVKVPLFDRRGKPTDVAIYGGSKLKIAFTMRGFANDAAYMAGVTLDIAAVQVIEAQMSLRDAGSYGFGTEDDDEYEEAEEDEGNDQFSDEGSSDDEEEF